MKPRGSPRLGGITYFLILTASNAILGVPWSILDPLYVVSEIAQTGAKLVSWRTNPGPHVKVINELLL